MVLEQHQCWNAPAVEVDGNPIQDLFRYKIYRGPYPNFPIESRFFLCYSNGASTTFTDPWSKYNAQHYYRVTAVDRAGNESAPTASLGVATDYILMISRSSRWLHFEDPTDTYLKVASTLVAALTEQMPNDSRVGILVFRDKVFSTDTALKPVTEGGRRGFQSGLAGRTVLEPDNCCSRAGVVHRGDRGRTMEMPSGANPQ